MRRLKTTTRALGAATLVLMAVTSGAGPAAAQQASSVDASAAKGYLGAWTLVVDIQGNPTQMDLEVQDAGGKVVAVLHSPRRPEPLRITDISLSEEGMKLSYEADRQGTTVQLNLVVKLEDDKLAGTLGAVGGQFSAPLKGMQKQAQETPQETLAEIEASSLAVDEAEDFLGNWALELSIQDNPVSMDLALSDRDGKLAAVMSSTQGEQVITDITKTDDGLKFEFDSDFGHFILQAKVDGDRLTGTFSDEDGVFSSAVEGERTDDEEAQRRQRRRRRARPETHIAVDEKAITIRYADPPAGEGSFEQLAAVKDGEVIRFLRHGAIKLSTEHKLKFADAVIETENVAKDYPGVYSLWLKKAGGGWHLVFNSLPDVWGSQHSAEADVAQVPLDYSKGDTPTEKLSVKLTAVADGGLLELMWGEHRWTTTFAIVQ